MTHTNDELSCVSINISFKRLKKCKQHLFAKGFSWELEAKIVNWRKKS